MTGIGETDWPNGQAVPTSYFQNKWSYIVYTDVHKMLFLT